MPNSQSVVPVFDSCLVCEQIRPELNGKLIILGYFGICPDVDVALQHLDQPSVLTFLVSGGPGEGTFMASFDIFDEAEQRVIAGVAPIPVVATPNMRSNLAPTLLAIFGHVGLFAIRCTVDGNEHFRATFRVSQGIIA